MSLTFLLRQGVLNIVQVHLMFKRVFTAFSSTPALLVGNCCCISNLRAHGNVFERSRLCLHAKVDTNIIDITTEVEANLVAHCSHCRYFSFNFTSKA